MTLSVVPFYVNRSAKIEEFLTHYFVLFWRDGPVAIGEAGGVEESHVGVKAYVAEWLRDSQSGDVNEGVFHGNMCWRTLAGSGCSVIPKAVYCGVSLKNHPEWCEPLKVNPAGVCSDAVAFTERQMSLRLLLATASASGTDIGEMLHRLKSRTMR